jgi:hypothetical protein
MAKKFQVSWYIMSLAATLIIISIAVIGLAVWPAPVLGRQCSSLTECLQYANTGGTYDASYYDSYSSPGGTATVKKTYAVASGQVASCNACIQIFTSGYGNSTAPCPEEWNCSGVLKQTDVIRIISGMNVITAFRLGQEQCFYGTVESFDAIACFDETNRIVNYGEQGRRPFYGFSITGFETELPFGRIPIGVIPQ